MTLDDAMEKKDAASGSGLGATANMGMQASRLFFRYYAAPDGEMDELRAVV